MLQYTLTGRLTAEPELTTYGADNTPMARLRVASNQPGSEQTDFFDVAVFGDKALEALAAARKGDKVHLKGSGRQHVWNIDSGETRERISLAARFVEHTPRAAHSTATGQHTHTATASAAR
jgi:single-stranded DNA-binding protein